MHDPLTILPFRLCLFTGLIVCLFTSLAAAQPLNSLSEVYSLMQPHTGPHTQGVDTTTLDGKVMCGYQGWFAPEGDGSGLRWFHYAGADRKFEPGHCTIDFWPDTRELDADEKFPTPFKHADSSTAYVFSPFVQKTVVRHFQWMRDYGIDGVFLQRFGASLKDPRHLNHRNVVTANVQAGANRFGRTWAMMYDLSGLAEGEVEKVIIEDWKQLIDRARITKDPAYLHHHGKPVVAVWGVGFGDKRKYTIDECGRLIDFLKKDPRYGNNTVMLGIPSGWRTQSADALKDNKLREVLAKADILSPWSVGRYRTPDQVVQRLDSIKQDIAQAGKQKQDYLPVIFPGFSWHNMHLSRGEEKPLNQIPRLGGAFLWAQARVMKQAGAKMLYVAMFDEIDEGTAIFKCANNPPVGASPFVTYEGLPNDHYLWLTGQTSRLLKGEIPADAAMPIRR